MTMTEDTRAPLPLLDELRHSRAQIRADLEALAAEREALATRAAGAMLERESAALEHRAAELRDYDGALEERIAGIEANRAAADRAGEMAARYGIVRVTGEPQIYRPDDSERSFFADLYARDVLRNSEAAERLARHATATLEALAARDITVSSVGGLLPPAYLVDEYAHLARAGRHFADLCQPRPLPPEGVSFNVPRITTGSAAAQTSEAAGWNEQNLVAANETRTVELTTAQQDLSRTLFERGGFEVDRTVWRDLAAAVETTLDGSLLAGDGTSPQHLGVLNVAGISTVTYTDASPTMVELWPKLADAVQRVNSLRFAPATAWVMHPRRWGWITAAVDNQGRPLFNFSTEAPPNVVMALGKAAAYGVVGTMMGLPVVTDASVPTNLGAGTNEDAIICARIPDILYTQDPLLQFTFEQALTTAPGQIRLAAGRVALFIAGRYPAAISVVRGTGLIATF
ncbi:MAG: phage major capsid protein [Acidimicrobiia bacterium]